MKKNIVLVGLDRLFNDEVGKALANKLDLFFVSATDLIEYSLLDSKEMVVKCGVDYFVEQEKKVLKSLSNYENTIISIDYPLFINNEACNAFKKNSIIVYVKLSAEELSKRLKVAKADNTGSLVVDLIDYNDKNKKLENLSDLVAYVDNASTKIYLDTIIQLLSK